MELILKIAWRNILRHRGKSLVIGAILFLGAFIMTLGNGIVTGMDAGIRKNIVNSFMGDIVLISAKQKSDNVLVSMMGAAIEPINTFKSIKEVLDSQSFVEQYIPVGKNMVMILKEDENQPGFTYLMGVDFDKYMKMFPNSFRIIEGSALKTRKKGLLIPTHAREDMYMLQSTWLIPEGGKVIRENLSRDALENIASISAASSVVMMGMASAENSSVDIRLGIKGIIKYHALNNIFGNFCLTDIESYRECMGYISAMENSIEVTKEERQLLGMESTDMDNLFGNGSLIVENKRTEQKNISKSTAATAPGFIDGEFGIYNLVFIKLKPGITYKTALENLNRALEEKNCEVRAVAWNKASGPIGSMTIIIKSALFVFVMLLFVVAIIIIINTLTMAALERTSEIGMMRAIGAKKSFIGGMFFGETGILSAVFGGSGILLGIIAVKIIPILKITTSNDMVQLLYGGDIFHPNLMAPDILLTISQLCLVTLVAALYPVCVARGIKPLDAIQRD